MNNKNKIPEIYQYNFNKDSIKEIEETRFGQNWPVVYLIHDDNNKSKPELYVGETSNMKTRFEQHQKNKERKRLDKIEIIYDQQFNKSAILDIEQMLIQYFSVDKKYKLQNRNGGQSIKHNYYQRSEYLDKIDYIWDKLMNIGLCSKDLNEIRNADIFKYSPYTSLTIEQSKVCNDIIDDIINKLSNNKEGTFILEGGPGTGKTIVMINVIYKLLNSLNINIDTNDEDYGEFTDTLYKINLFKKQFPDLKIGFIVPMEKIRKTIGNVFKEIPGLFKNMLIGPLEVLESKKIENSDTQTFIKPYDIVFIDEGHRLVQKYGNYDNNRKEKAIFSGLDPEEASTLDIIIKNTKYQVIVYDKGQTVKSSDITDKSFNETVSKNKPKSAKLTTQMRCVGGESYISYLNSIFDCSLNEMKEMDNDYEFELFEDVDDMFNCIRKLNNIHEYKNLCRMVAGYSWEWKTKKCKSYEEALNMGGDIHIGDYNYVWNLNNKPYISRKESINEIGCIHTTQGYDLSYVGVILGKEIDYDPIKNEIIINPKEFYDAGVKKDSKNKLIEFIINAYKVLMTRGIKGCFVYACNKNMQEYLKKYIKVRRDN